MTFLTNSDVQKIAEILNETLRFTFVRKVKQLGKNLFLISFSKKNTHLLIALNNDFPLAMLSEDTDLKVDTPSSFFNELNRLLKNALLKNITALENERILKINFEVSDKSLQKVPLFMYIELIPHHANIIITDADDKILLAFRYSKNVDAKKIIRRNQTYDFIPNKVFNSYPRTLTDDELLLLSINYIKNNYHNILKDNYKEVFNSISVRLERALRKKKVLENELKRAMDPEDMVEQANLLLTYQPKLEGTRIKLENHIIEVDPFISAIENANKLFRKAKKQKNAIKFLKEQIILNDSVITTLTKVSSNLENASQDQIEHIKNQLRKEKQIDKEFITPKHIPYFTMFKGVKIGYGRMSIQNDYLTFTLTKKEHYFLHVKDYPGAHVIIFDSNPTDEILLVAGCLALYISSIDIGEVVYTQVKNLKKAGAPGLVKMSKYKTFKVDVKNAPIDMKTLLSKSERF